MDTLQSVLDAITDLLSEAVSATLATEAVHYDNVRATARNLKDGAVLNSLLGPQLSKLANLLVGEVERKTVGRYANYLRHPRHRREPLIDEAENADVSLNSALLAAQASPGASSNLGLLIAIMRVRTITKVTGSACIYPAHVRTAGDRSGASPRRRETTAADVPVAIAAVLLRPVADSAQYVAIIEALSNLQKGEAGVLATKLGALLEEPDGPDMLRTLADRIRRARAKEGLSPDIYDVPPFAESATRPATHTPAPRTLAKAPDLITPAATDEVRAAGERSTGASERFRAQGQPIASAKTRLAQSYAKHNGAKR